MTSRSAPVPPDIRKAKSIEAALPWRYLKGVSTAEMGTAVKRLPGPQATGFSAKTICRLTGQWAMGNGLDDLPKRTQAEARKRLRDSWQAETGADAHEACDLFIGTFGATYPGAAEWLIKGRDALLTFHDVPAPHWQSMRRSHPIESALATIRHRTRRTKGGLSRDGLLQMMVKLGHCAEKIGAHCAALLLSQTS